MHVEDSQSQLVFIKVFSSQISSDLVLLWETIYFWFIFSLCFTYKWAQYSFHLYKVMRPWQLNRKHLYSGPHPAGELGRRLCLCDRERGKGESVRGKWAYNVWMWGNVHTSIIFVRYVVGSDRSLRSEMEECALKVTAFQPSHRMKKISLGEVNE